MAVEKPTTIAQGQQVQGGKKIEWRRRWKWTISGRLLTWQKIKKKKRIVHYDKCSCRRLQFSREDNLAQRWIGMSIVGGFLASSSFLFFLTELCELKKVCEVTNVEMQRRKFEKEKGRLEKEKTHFSMRWEESGSANRQPWLWLAISIQWKDILSAEE